MRDEGLSHAAEDAAISLDDFLEFIRRSIVSDLPSAKLPVVRALFLQCAPPRLSLPQPSCHRPAALHSAHRLPPAAVPSAVPSALRGAVLSAMRSAPPQVRGLRRPRLDVGPILVPVLARLGTPRRRRRGRVATWHAHVSAGRCGVTFAGGLAYWSTPHGRRRCGGQPGGFSRDSFRSLPIPSDPFRFLPIPSDPLSPLQVASRPSSRVGDRLPFGAAFPKGEVKGGAPEAEARPAEPLVAKADAEAMLRELGCALDEHTFTEIFVEVRCLGFWVLLSPSGLFSFPLTPSDSL